MYYTTWFARPDALKGTLKNSLVACKPTIFLGVPRVWEKVRLRKGSRGDGAPLERAETPFASCTLPPAPCLLHLASSPRLATAPPEAKLHVADAHATPMPMPRRCLCHADATRLLGPLARTDQGEHAGDRPQQLKGEAGHRWLGQTPRARRRPDPSARRRRYFMQRSSTCPPCCRACSAEVTSADDTSPLPMTRHLCR